MGEIMADYTNKFNNTDASAKLQDAVRLLGLNDQKAAENLALELLGIFANAAPRDRNIALVHHIRDGANLAKEATVESVISATPDGHAQVTPSSQLKPAQRPHL